MVLVICAVVNCLGRCRVTYHLSVLVLEGLLSVGHYVTGSERLFGRERSSRCQRRGHVVILCWAAAAGSFLNSAIVSVREVVDLPAIDSLMILGYVIVSNLRRG